MNLLRQHIYDFNEERKKLRHRWELTKKEWDDPVRHGFDKEMMSPLLDQAQQTQREMERLLHVVEQAYNHVK